MTPKQYQELASRTECHQQTSRDRMIGRSCVETIYIANEATELIPIRVNHSVIGVCGEVGEICDLVHKYFYIHPPVMDTREYLPQLTLELGDLMWYLAEGWNALGFDLTQIVERSIEPASNECGSINVVCTSLSRESGRYASELQRWIYYGKYDDINKKSTFQDNVIKIGRMIMGLINGILEIYDITLEHVMVTNIAKLQVRYPDKYTDFHAADENRDRGKEESVVNKPTT